MPAFVSHSLFGKEVLAALPNESLRRFLLLHEAAFEWGLQGPDLLFFYGTLPPSLSHTLNRLGGRMHREQTDALFSDACRYLLELQPSSCKKESLAYFLGFCCHYCLDCAVHPFVYYWQEQLKQHYSANMHRSLHNRLESDMDSEIFFLKTGQPIHYFYLSPKLTADKSTLLAIAHFYQHLLGRVYGQAVALRAIRRCATSAYRVIRVVLNRPHMWEIANLLDHLAGKKNALSAHIRKKRAERDVLNLAHLPWSHLRTGQRHTESYWDLEEQAARAAAGMLQRIWNDQSKGQASIFSALLPFDNGSPL